MPPRTVFLNRSRQLLDALQNNFGSVPNLKWVLAEAPAALDGRLPSSGALAGGVLIQESAFAPTPDVLLKGTF